MPTNGIQPAKSPFDRWEVGGEFHWMGLPTAPFISWPEPASWYLLGRHALVSLIQFLPPRPRRLWVPSYFCFDVADYWRTFIEVAAYSDDPRNIEPDWSTLHPASDDVVIAVNYFGVRSGEKWRHWHNRNPCIFAEDHSHDPVSGWALQSNAEYAFASLRKTLPVPDGAILWSPRGLPLPAAVCGDGTASALKLAAMLWKREYLSGNSTLSAKATYRTWQQDGEVAFNNSALSAATDWSRQYLSSGVPATWRKKRVANTRHLLTKLPAGRGFQPMFEDWPPKAAPLGAVFEFETSKLRDASRRRLQKLGIYCPVHWPPSPGCEPAARHLAGRLLTIPTDQRYSPADMEKIAAILQQASSARHR